MWPTYGGLAGWKSLPYHFTSCKPKKTRSKSCLCFDALWISNTNFNFRVGVIGLAVSEWQTINSVSLAATHDFKIYPWTSGNNFRGWKPDDRGCEYGQRIKFWWLNKRQWGSLWSTSEIQMRHSGDNKYSLVQQNSFLLLCLRIKGLPQLKPPSSQLFGGRHHLNKL